MRRTGSAPSKGLRRATMFGKRSDRPSMKPAVTTNYWRDKVELLIDEKKRQMKEMKSLRNKLKKLEEKNAKLEAENKK